MNWVLSIHKRSAGYLRVRPTNRLWRLGNHLINLRRAFYIGPGRNCLTRFLYAPAGKQDSFFYTAGKIAHPITVDREESQFSNQFFIHYKTNGSADKRE